MIPVDSITEKELDRRFETLPAKLKEALTSERNLSVVNEVCQKNKIGDEDKVVTLQQIVGLVMLGVVHYYDVGPEINEALSLNNQKFSSAIAEELNAKVFSPIKTDLENNYQPLVSALSQKDSGAPAVLPISPKPISTVPPAQPLVKTPSTPTLISTLPANQPPASSMTGPAKPAPLPVNKMAPPAPTAAARPAQPVPPPQKPVTTSDIGWSKTQTSGPVIKLDTSNLPPTPPTAAPASTLSRSSQGATVTPRPTAFITPGPVSEFDRLNIKDKSPLTGAQPGAATAAASSPTASATPTPTKPAGDPPPVMLHQDTSFKAPEKNAGFTLARPGSTAEIKLTPGGPQTPTRSAVLELGGSNPSAPKPPAAGSSGVVHYTEFKPSLSSVPTANSGPRNVSQITPPSAKPLTPLAPMPTTTPMPPTPPRAQAAPSSATIPPSVPRPPQAPVAPGKSAPVPSSAPTAPQGEKVIVKDFI